MDKNTGIAMALPVKIEVSSHYSLEGFKEVIFLNQCWNYRRIIKLINANRIRHPAVIYWERRSKKIARALRLHLRKTCEKAIPAHAYTRLGFGEKGFNCLYFLRSPKKIHFLSVNRLNLLGLSKPNPQPQDIEADQQEFLYRLATDSLYSEAIHNLERSLSLGFTIDQIAPNAPSMAFNPVNQLIQTDFEGYHYETDTHPRSKTPHWPEHG